MNRTKIVILILITVIIAFSGCVQQLGVPNELPEDFDVKYGTGAIHAEWEQFNFEMDNQGNAIFEKTMGTDKSEKYEFIVSESERKKIYDAVVINNFFSLKDKYEDPTIMDGGWSEITITANGESKTAILLNENQEQFAEVENEIEKAIISELGIDAFSITNLMNE